jgi:hypothetical protein
MQIPNEKLFLKKCTEKGRVTDPVLVGGIEYRSRSDKKTGACPKQISDFFCTLPSRSDLKNRFHFTASVKG